MPLPPRDPVGRGCFVRATLPMPDSADGCRYVYKYRALTVTITRRGVPQGGFGRPIRTNGHCGGRRARTGAHAHPASHPMNEPPTGFHAATTPTRVQRWRHRAEHRTPESPGPPPSTTRSPMATPATKPARPTRSEPASNSKSSRLPERERDRRPTLETRGTITAARGSLRRTAARPSLGSAGSR